MTVGPDRSRIQAIKFGALNLGALNQRTVRAAFAFLASVLHFFIKTEVALGKTCESAFVTAAFTQPSSKSTQPASPYQLHLEQQVHQFNQLLIDSQSEKLSPIERQSRLADAQRIFIELTEAHPEIAELIQDEWRKLHSTSEHAVEAKRQRIIRDIQDLEQQLLSFKAQIQPLLKWEITRDSISDPAAKTELEDLLQNPDDLNNSATPLEIVAEYFIRVCELGSPSMINTRRVGGHTRNVIAAYLLPDGRVLSWSFDHTLIFWKRAKGTYVIDQILGESQNTRPDNGHTNWVNGALVMPDGRLLSWSGDRTLILWKLVNGSYAVDLRLGKIQNKDPNKGHTSTVTSANILSNKSIVSSDDTGRYLLWQIALPPVVQMKIDKMTNKLNSLKASLNRLESQRASTDINRTGGER